MRSSSPADIILNEAERLQPRTLLDRIIDHLKLKFVAEKPPPSHVFQQVALMAAEERTVYF
jgi:hypothetical protein